MRTRVENKSTCERFVKTSEKDKKTHQRLLINIFTTLNDRGSIYLTEVEIWGHLQLGFNDFAFSLKSLRLTEIHRNHLFEPALQLPDKTNMWNNELFIILKFAKVLN